MIKLLAAFRWIVNPIFQSKLINKPKKIKRVKKVYSFFFTRSGVKNVSKYIVEIDENIKDILIKYNGYIGCGNCLFLARGQKDFGNNDIDYCVQGVNKSNVNKFIADMENKGFVLYNALYYEDKLIELKFNYKKTYVDIFVLEVLNDKYVNSYTILMNDKFPIIAKKGKIISLENCCVVEQKWSNTKKTIPKKMFNHKFLIPENYEDYLTLQYGANWRTPIKDFDFLHNPKSNLPKLYDGKGVIKYVNSKTIFHS